MLLWPFFAGLSGCQPVGPLEEVAALVAAGDPALEEWTVLARALVADAAPFPLVGATRLAEALSEESGAAERRAGIAWAESRLELAKQSFAELEDEAALALVAEATPPLVAGQVEPRALALLAEAHLLAGSIHLARGRLDAASSRLERALDLAPRSLPTTDLRLLGALEVSRARAARRPRGGLSVRWTGGSTSAAVFVDGRRLGWAPGPFLDLPAGRHLLRVSSADHRSHIGTVQVEAGRLAAVQVVLRPDLDRAGLSEMPRRLAAGLPLGEGPARLARRANADRALVVAVAPAPVRSPSGLALGLALELSGAGRTFAPALDRATVTAALRALARCESAPEAAAIVPAIPPRPRPFGPVPARRDSEAPWRSPWMWAVLAMGVVGLAAGLAAGHGANSPPDGLRVTLVPRP